MDLTTTLTTNSKIRAFKKKKKASHEFYPCIHASHHVTRMDSKVQLGQMFCTSFANVKHSCDVCRYIKIKPQVFPFGQGPPPLEWSNPHCIETLSVGLVIDSFTSRPFAKQWSLISWLHRGPLRGNGHRFLYIKTLSFGMVKSNMSDRDPRRESSHRFLCLLLRIG